MENKELDQLINYLTEKIDKINNKYKDKVKINNLNESLDVEKRLSKVEKKIKIQKIEYMIIKQKLKYLAEIITLNEMLEKTDNKNEQTFIYGKIKEKTDKLKIII